MLALALVPAATAGAATQSRDDPSDASGGADLRKVAWDVSGSSATLTVSLNDNAFADIGVHLLLDTDDDGIADAELVATRNADGKQIDVKLRELNRTLSTPDCQDLAGKDTSAQGTVSSTVSGGLETFSFSFDPTIIAGNLASFRWAAFGQAPADLAGFGRWDYLPDAANPDPGAGNPGDRRCDSAKSGLSIRMSAGVKFPEPAQPTPTPTPGQTPGATPTPGPAPKPVVVLALPSGQPQAGGIATIDAHATVPPAGTHIVAFEWDVNGDHHVDANTGTNPIFHLPAGTAGQTVIVTAIDSHFNAGSAAMAIAPGPSPQHCEAEASIRILRIQAACITRTGDVTRASGTPSNRYWDHYVIDLNGLSLVTRDPAAYVSFDEGNDEIVGHGEFRVMSLNAPGGDITWYDSGADGFSWPMPSGTRGVPSMVSLGVAQHCPDDSEATHCFQVPGGFPVTGQIGVGIDAGTLEAVLDVQASIESGIRVTTGIRLRSSLALGGITLDSLRFRVNNASFGVLTLRTLAFTYEPPGTGAPAHEGDLWDVAMAIELETPHFLVAGRMVFENGPLTFAGAEVAFDPGILVYPAVFLNHFGADFGVGNTIRLGGLIGASVIEILQIDGTWNYLARSDGTIALSIGGHATLAGGDLANLELQFWNDGYFSYSGRLGYTFPSDDPSFELYGQTDYWVEPEPGSDRNARFQGHGELAVAFHHVRIAAAEMFINNNYAAGCGFGYRGMHSYRPGIPDVMQIVLAHCDVAEYTIAPLHPHEGITFPSASSAQAPAAPPAKSITVAPHERALVLQVAGVGGAPRLALTDPKGKTYTPTATQTNGRPVTDGAFSSAYLPQGDITLLRVEKPIAGEWVLSPRPGSPAIQSVTSSKALPPLKVSARVSGSGRRRTLKWNATGLAGRTLRFTERAHDVGQTIVVTKKAKGSAAWSLQGGSAGPRKVEADVLSEKGIPFATPVVTSFRAPGPPRPGRPGRVTVRRRGETAVIRWPKLKGATGYTVKVRGSDGRREVFFPRAPKHQVLSLRVAKTTKLTVAVAGWIATHRIAGKPRSATLRAVKAKTKKAKRRSAKKAGVTARRGRLISGLSAAR